MKKGTFPIKRITSGPNYHFIGYYGSQPQPWDARGKYLLCLEVPFQNRPPQAEDSATVGIIDLSRLEFIPLARTYAWNFQQGAMVHWLPPESDSEIIFNVRQGKEFFSVILDIHSGNKRILPRPISALSHNGKYALSLNFARLHVTRPGYGYAGVEDPFCKEPHPDKDGIYLLDLEKGEAKLIVSIKQIVDLYPHSEKVKDKTFWFNHTLFNPQDTRFAFLSRWKPEENKPHLTALFTANIDGSEVRCLVNYGLVSHYDWRNSEEILVWMEGRKGKGFYLVEDREGGENKIVGKGILREDGHCSFSSSGEWILLDTYPDENRYQTLKIFNLKEEREIILGKFYSPPLFQGEIRCDLHPRWNREDTQVCFDSVHEGERQVYIMDVSQTTLRKERRI